MLWVVGCLCDEAALLGDKINGTLVLPSTSDGISQIPEISAGSFVSGELPHKDCVVTTFFFRGFLQSLQSKHGILSKVTGRKIV